MTIPDLPPRVNGFYVYLYDGPRVPEFDRPGVANVDKVKGKVSVFLGIPYAQAPKGEARLMPPRPHKGWQTYDAVDWAPVCPQPIRFVGVTQNAPLMDEDCLYLNVFTPTVILILKLHSSAPVEVPTDLFMEFAMKVFLQPEFFCRFR